MKLPPSLAQVGEDNAEVVAAPPLFFLAPLVVGLVVEYFVPTMLLAGAPRWVLGTLLALAGPALQGWAFSSMKKVGTTPLPARPTTALTFAGPYRFTRNPMYVSFALLTAGVAVLTSSAWVLAAVPVGIVGVTFGAIRREERYLERKFGAEYVAYKARVRRWI
ncbi:MAG: methyltransferase family protein [Thermoplasmatota archaeon]